MWQLLFSSKVKEMMEDVRQAFREEVGNLTWIDDKTRPAVYEKVKPDMLSVMWQVNKASTKKTWRTLISYGELKIDLLLASNSFC